MVLLVGFESCKQTVMEYVEDVEISEVSIPQNTKMSPPSLLPPSPGLSTIEKCCISLTCDWLAIGIPWPNHRRDTLIGQKWDSVGLTSIGSYRGRHSGLEIAFAYDCFSFPSWALEYNWVIISYYEAVLSTVETHLRDCHSFIIIMLHYSSQ